jgi:SAM-dependent methyltransferase
VSSDIFAAQPADADLLAELYDLEHDAVVEDLAFYREMARRAGGAVLDAGCGSGRLFRSLVEGGAPRVVGVDGSPALLARAQLRVAADPLLRSAAAERRLELVHGDVRRLPALGLGSKLPGRGAALAVAAGVLPHLDGPEEALELLGGVARLLAPAGRLVLDDLGPGLIPQHDLPLSVDWQRAVGGRSVVRRSQLTRREAPEGLRVAFSTIVDVGQADGTIARLPAAYRLWYPSHDALAALVREAGLAVELAYGSHDLDPLDEESDRRILVIRHAVG